MRFLWDRFSISGSKNQVIGLDIGCATIKCVVLKRGNSDVAYQFKNYSIGFVPPGSIENNQIKASSQLVARIKELLAEAAIPSAYCVAALPELLVSSKWIRIDSSATENLALAVNLAVEEHIPYPLDAIYFDYQVFSTQQDESYLNVLVVACRKEHVDARLEVIQQSNLIPLAIEINSHAIERAYTYFYPDSTAVPFLLIDVGTTQLTFLFSGANKKIISFSESVDIAGKETLVQRIQRGMQALCLSYPYLSFSKLFFVGADYALLQFLVEKLDGSYGLETKIVASNGLFPGADTLNKEFISQFPALFLSFGLALRGFTIPS